MDYITEQLLNDVNRAIIKFRGVYSEWSKKHNISYNEMLVLYTIRENGYCTQKQICDNYLLPRQTINHVITNMRKEEILIYNKEKSLGREKAFSLTEKGETYAKEFLLSLNTIETQAVEKMGMEKFLTMTKLIQEYSGILEELVDKNS